MMYCCGFITSPTGRRRVTTVPWPEWLHIAASPLVAADTLNPARSRNGAKFSVIAVSSSTNKMCEVVILYITYQGITYFSMKGLKTGEISRRLGHENLYIICVHKVV